MAPRSKTPKPHRDLYAEVTNALVAAIEANPGDPQMPWRRSSGPLWRPVNAVTQQPYRGINVVMLWGAAETSTTADGRPFSSNRWATYRQYAEAGAQVRKGEKASLIVKYGEYEISEEKRAKADDGDSADDGKRLYLKAYHVFNAAQVDGAPEAETPPEAPVFERIAAAERFIANTGAHIVEGGDRAFYRPSTDTIHMPDPALFTGTASMTAAESWAAVKAHETIHWTSAPARLDRQLGKRFGDDQYAVEELIAEIGSALICADLAITPAVRPDHAQYLAHWLTIMKGNARAIFTAAAAERAVRYLHDLQPKDATPDAEPPAESCQEESAANRSEAAAPVKTSPKKTPPPQRRPAPSAANASRNADGTPGMTETERADDPSRSSPHRSSRKPRGFDPA